MVNINGSNAQVMVIQIENDRQRAAAIGQLAIFPIFIAAMAAVCESNGEEWASENIGAEVGGVSPVLGDAIDESIDLMRALIDSAHEQWNIGTELSMMDLLSRCIPPADLGTVATVLAGRASSVVYSLRRTLGREARFPEEVGEIYDIVVYLSDCLAIKEQDANYVGTPVGPGTELTGVLGKVLSESPHPDFALALVIEPSIVLTDTEDGFDFINS